MPFNYAEEIQALKNKEQEIISVARGHGEEEVPATPDIELNATQFNIKNQCQRITRDLIADTKLSINTYSGQLESNWVAIESGVALPDLENMKSTIEQEIGTMLAYEGPMYIDKKVEHWNSEKNLKVFKRDKGISDVPLKAPESQKAHYMTLMAYAIIETIFNMFIFNEGLSGRDALTLSVFISILNILPAVVVGNFLRNIHTENSLLKITSISLVVFWLGFLYWLNTSVSILRSFLTQSMANIGAGNLPEFDLFSNPQIPKIFFQDAFSIYSLKAPPIGDVLSIFLWLVGILAGLLACWKGYTADEKIPELGNLSRDFELKKEVAVTSEKSLREKLSQMIARQADVFKNVKNKFEQNKRDYLSCAQLLNQKVVEFERHIESFKDEYEHLIRVYRDSNKVARKSPPPAYFDQSPPDLEVGAITDFSGYLQERMKEHVAALEEIYLQRNASLNALQAEFNVFIESTNAKFEEKLGDLDKRAGEAMIRLW
ncbi:hypothetical protein G6698_01675 [Polynucleobacter paneuropaeus]|jgi:hypothetical protein|nr:hypothetical protein [Polynucleobacter paneuropaeus]MBT8576016.1 hypothetical protein [Polynucleobacter paneuropaeus]MBT8604540.1 hypothetical protein [Polynucleobacter paneuropaeus]